ncbi:hypothetical protein AAFF_G00039890 [Aldrovandia affinis]|uniref:Uncharacterized protein n=1 Tax=Aldrovandia affinis TaxID=143900 RepID=A0AAD7WFL9_9TELE|nr:hypothetical protein AAFF_G00039890 [Aldrovandia affinis]
MAQSFIQPHLRKVNGSPLAKGLCIEHQVHAQTPQRSLQRGDHKATLVFVWNGIMEDYGARSRPRTGRAGLFHPVETKELALTGLGSSQRRAGWWMRLQQAFLLQPSPQS